MSKDCFMDTANLIDGFIIIVYFTVILGIGFAFKSSNKTLSDYAIGGRNIPWWAVLASIIAAETSAATFLGAPAEGFKTRSFLYAQLVIGTILARIIIAYLFIKPYYTHNVQSIYELLEQRFGAWTRNMASLLFMVSRLLGVGVRLYLGGVIFVVLWRYLFHTEPELIHYIAGITIVTLLTAAYTAVGGIKAVVYTDLLQAILMLGGALLAVATLWHSVSGNTSAIPSLDLSNFFNPGIKAGDTFAQALTNILTQPYNIFAALIGSTFLTLATHGCDQDMVQRMLTAKNVQESRRSLILSGLADIPVVLLFLAIGLLLAAYYTLHPDPTLPSSPNEVFAHYIVTAIPVGFRGLIIAGVLATMMGSTSAALNSLATSFAKDWYLPYFAKPGEDETRKISVARWATFVFSILLLAVASLAAYQVLHNPGLTIIPMALSVFSCTYGSLLGVFLLAVLTKNRGSNRWNVFAMAMGILAVLIFGKIKLSLGLMTLNFGQLIPANWPAIAWTWHVLIGCTVTFSLGFLRKKVRNSV